jgi:hypothetical protein
MKKIGLRMIVVALVVIAGWLWTKKPESKVHAQGMLGQTCVSYVPKAWGTYRGGSQQSGLSFEDSTGTLRFVTQLPCNGEAIPALVIQRTAPAAN